MKIFSENYCVFLNNLVLGIRHLGALSQNKDNLCILDLVLISTKSIRLNLQVVENIAYICCFNRDITNTTLNFLQIPLFHALLLFS